jgi:HK97 family phage portal protein
VKSALRRTLQNAASPVPMGSGGFYKLPGLALGSNQTEALLRAYGTVGTIFSIVSLYASATARPLWQLFRSQQEDANRYTTRDEGSDQRAQVFKHQALSVLQKPAVAVQPGGAQTVIWSRFGLFEVSQMYLDLTGESYWVVERDPRSPIPLGLWPVRPDRMEPVPSERDYLAGYVYTSPDGRTKIPLDVTDVIFVKYPNPLDAYHGLGPVQSVLVDIDAAKYSAEWNRNFFINSATPGGVIQVPNNLSEAEFNELTNRWRETHRGVSRAHRVAVLEGGATWVPNQYTMRDMDFGNLRGVMRDVMREAFRMHKVMLGVSDDVNRANAQTGEEVFASWGVVPRLDRWRDALDNQFLPLFGSAGRDVEWDYVTPVPANREQDNAELTAKTTALALLVTAGFDADEAAAVVGLPQMGFERPAVPVPVLPAPAVPPDQSGIPGESGDSDMANLLRLMAPLNQRVRVMR